MDTRMVRLGPWTVELSAEMAENLTHWRTALAEHGAVGMTCGPAALGALDVCAVVLRDGDWCALPATVGSRGTTWGGRPLEVRADGLYVGVASDRPSALAGEVAHLGDRCPDGVRMAVRAVPVGGGILLACTGEGEHGGRRPEGVTLRDALGRPVPLRRARTLCAEGLAKFGHRPEEVADGRVKLLA